MQRDRMAGGVAGGVVGGVVRRENRIKPEAMEWEDEIDVSSKLYTSHSTLQIALYTALLLN